jgi:hypothetical protein
MGVFKANDIPGAPVLQIGNDERTISSCIAWCSSLVIAQTDGMVVD